MMRRVVSVLGVGVLLSFPLCLTALSGPLYDAAMAEVQRGVDTCPTGNLDNAMKIFKGVETRFPEEKEAIGWARYYHSDCLLAGLRRPEVEPVMRPVWGWAAAGEITNPTACFLFGHQYARSLDTGNLMRSVSERTLEFYEQLKDPAPEIEEKAGFLSVFLTRCYFSTREYAAAAAAGEAAWRKGEALRKSLDPMTAKDKGIKPLVLAAWGRLEQAKAERAQGNVLLAQVYLTECADEYSPRMERGYVSEVETTQGDCRLQLGMNEEVRATVLDKVISTDDKIDKGLWLRATWSFADEAYERGATEEAIAPMAVARTCYVAFPGWGLHIDLLWQRKIRGHTPNELFIPELQKQMDEGGNLERAAIRIQLAEILAEENRGAEGLALLDQVPTLSTDPRLSMGLRVARVHCESPGDWQAEVAAYEAVLAEATGNRGTIDYVLDKVRPYGRDRRKVVTFGIWLDERKDILPDDVYRLEKARWFLDFIGDDKSVLGLVEPLLENPDPDVRLKAHVTRTVCLYRGPWQDRAAAALRDFEADITNVAQREEGYFRIADALTYKRPEVAISVADKILATRVSKHWADHALLVKGSALSWMDRADEAMGPFNELATSQVSETVGDGLVRMGEVCWKRLKDYDTPRANFEAVIASREQFPPAQATAYQFYAEMEESLGNHQRALEICREGMANIDRSDIPGRGWMRLIRGRVTYRSVDQAAGRTELEELAGEYPDPKIRKLAGQFLQEEGGQ